MSRHQWLFGAALAMLIAAPAMSQESTDPSQADARAIHEQAQTETTLNLNTPLLIGEPIKFWLGIYCSPVPPALRSHVALPEKQGILALVITKDSPAAKAGLAQYDILLRAGGKPLAEGRDLVAAVEAAKETKLKIDLIRGGKPKTIEVTPAQRPAQAADGSVQSPDQADWNTIQGWLEGMAPGQVGAGPHPPMQFRVFGPGAIVPNNVLVPKSLPANTSVVINKDGDEPAKITVKRGNDKWEVTEKELDKLPADVRPYVEQMLGHGMFGVVGGSIAPNMGVRAQGAFSSSGGGTMQMPGFPPGMMQPPFSGSLEQRMEKRFDDMNRRMDQLFKMMEEMSEGRAQHATPERHNGK